MHPIIRQHWRTAIKEAVIIAAFIYTAALGIHAALGVYAEIAG